MLFRSGKGNFILNPFTARKVFLEMKKSYYETLLNPDANMEWIDAGLDFEVGRAPDYDYAMLNNKMHTFAEGMTKKGLLWKPFGYSLLATTRLKEMADHNLWEVMLPSMKLWAANRLYADYKTRVGDVSYESDQDLREQISRYVNDAFGGQEWEQYLWGNGKNRQMLQMLMFAPDWTLSAMNISGMTHIGPARKAINASGIIHAEQRMKRYWPAFAGIVLVGIPNILQGMIYGLTQAVGDDDEKEKVNMFTWQNEEGKELSVDITPLLKMINRVPILEKTIPDKGYGKTGERRAYLRWGKQAYEVFEGWLAGPPEAMKTLIGKSSTSVKVVMEQALGMRAPGWQEPFAGKGFMETLIETDGNLWDGRIAAVLKKFLPMSISPLLEEYFHPGSGKPSAFFAPVKMGMSSYKAQEEIASAIRAYAEGGIKANLLGLKNYERDLDKLVEKTLDAAEANGYKRKKVMKQGVAQARMFYYNRFFKALDRQDQKGMERAAEYLIRMDTKYGSLKASVERRLETRDEKPSPKQKIMTGKAWRAAMKRAAKKRRGED